MGMDFKKLREEMVEKQIVARGIKDKRVVEAMRRVERHLFVPREFRDKAYEDHPLPIGEGQTISQPYIVAYMTELLELHPDDRVLEIGTGSGYQTAILAELAGEIFTVELIPSLSYSARDILNELGYTNIVFKIGNGYDGWEERAPFDKIIVTAAPVELPRKLVEQLRVSGRMCIPIGEYDQMLYLVIKTEKGVQSIPKIPVAFVPLIREASGEYPQE